MKDIRNFLPSGRFASLVFSLALAGGLILAAAHFTAPQATTDESLATAQTPQIDKDWQGALYAIQGNNASSSLPAAPSEEAVSQALAAARTNNLTETVGRSLLINLSDVKQQGLGGDTVSQDKIVAQAVAQANAQKHTTYSMSDLTIVADASSTLHTYGNAVMQVLLKHPEANMNTALLAIGNAVDLHDPKPLEKLGPVGQGYTALAREFLLVPTPRSMASFHLLAVNDFFAIAEVIPGLQALTVDPLRGLVAVQQFEGLLSEEGRVFTNMAQVLQKRSILFSNGEPGLAWSAFLNKP